MLRTAYTFAARMMLSSEMAGSTTKNLHKETHVPERRSLLDAAAHI
jgi:hypothetical protein